MNDFATEAQASGHRHFTTMVKKLSNTNYGDTSKKIDIIKHQVVASNQIEKEGNVLEDMPITITWYWFTETKGKKSVEFDGKKILKRDVIIGFFSKKFRLQSPWGSTDIGNETERGRVRNAKTDILKSGIWIVGTFI